jgi:hypothetical protein
MKETPLKGVGTLKEDGGWLKVDSHSEVENLFKNSYSHFILLAIARIVYFQKSSRHKFKR